MTAAPLQKQKITQHIVRCNPTRMKQSGIIGGKMEKLWEKRQSGVLFIPSIKRTDAGNYTCRGRNVAGYSASDLVRVIVHCKSVILMKYKQIIISSDRYDALYNIDIADFFIDPPSGNPVIDNRKPPPVFYKDYDIEMTCSVLGGLPPANLSWDCPGLTSNTQRGNSSHSWMTASGTATIVAITALNEKTCTCTAVHYAWIPLGSNLRTVQTPNITVYCE